MKKVSRVFTPRPRSASRNTSCHTSRAVSPTRSPKSPSSSLVSTPVSAAVAAAVKRIAEIDHLPQATTWDSEAGTRRVLVGVKDGSKKPEYAILEEGADVASRHGVILELPEGQSIVFQGIVDVCVLSGAVTVYEHTVVPGRGWVRAYSPSSHPLVSILAVRPDREVTQGASGSDLTASGMQELWDSQTWPNDTEPKHGAVGTAAVIALRSVACGLEDIGIAAPPYRSLFTLKDFADRKASTQPKKAAKRKLAKALSHSATKIKRTMSGSPARDDAMAVDDTEDDKAAADTGGYDSDDSDDERPPPADYAQIEQKLRQAIGMPNFHPVSHMTLDLQLLQAPQDWRETLDRVADAGLQLDDSFEPISPTCVIAGGQGQGKSTFTRLLINRLLGRYGRLFYMETDLGQSEFSPPGALTLTMITDPLLGPPFTHASQIEPYHAIYMGVTTPKNDPDRYVVGIQRLSAVYRDYVSALKASSATKVADPQSLSATSDPSELSSLVVPLVVNTHGWLKGLGLDMHYSLCETVRPTTYIQLYDPAPGLGQSDSDAQQNWDASNELVPIIDFSSIEGCDPQLVWISAMNYERAAQMLHTRAPGTGIAPIGGAADEPAADLVTSSSLAGELAARKGPKLAAHDMRSLALISQLYAADGSVHQQQWNPALSTLGSPVWDMNSPLASRLPLAVPWSDLIFWLGDEDIPPSQVLRALNGTVVGVIATASAPSPSAHVWTVEEARALYQDSNGISDRAAIDLSEASARPLLRTAVEKHQLAHDKDRLGSWHMPQIVYGHPNTDETTFLTHALVRSIDPTEGAVHLLLPPLVTGSPSNSGADAMSSLHRIVGIVKGPGPGMSGIDLPVWPMIDGGYAERAMGSSAARKQSRFERRRPRGKGRGIDGDDDGDGNGPLGIQEAPYLSVETDEGIGASTARSRGGQMRHGLQ
ncbi:hypothetical protein GQ54DRAFT_297110 [Martensiomyces pterosporus]|nr:hypothetical protein GQ54DRAFT_297110 [Martensiomyces pterosporus]